MKILQSGEPVDLLVTDIGLPGINGRQLAEHARQSRSGMKVLFITGYAMNATMADGFLGPGMALITKPFGVSAFASKVRQVTGSAAP